MEHYERNLSKLLVSFDRFASKHIRHRNYLLLISFLVGVLSAIAAVVLKISVQFVEHRAAQLNGLLHSNWLTALFPMIGIGLSAIMLTRVFNGRLTKGVGYIIDRIFTKKARIPQRHVWGHMATSAVTVAFGGSVGLEAPIVSTGAAIGSNTGYHLRLSYKDTTLLLACGSASGIAAIFNSPIAGIIFALEVLLIDFNIPFFIPLLISTATATVLSQILYPDKFFFMVVHGWELSALPFYAILGSACGLVSVYTTNVVERIEHYLDKKKSNMQRWLIGGLTLCVIIFFLPGLYGEGYMLIMQLLRGNHQALTTHSLLGHMGNNPYIVVLMAVLLIGFKGVCAALTTGAGGNGGIFAPSLIIGGLVGFVFAFTVNKLGIAELSTANFIIVAMAGVLAGVMHAPLTAIFLLAEITGGYALFVPLMIVTAISYFMTRKYLKHSIYHRALAERNIIHQKTEEDHL